MKDNKRGIGTILASIEKLIIRLSNHFIEESKKMEEIKKSDWYNNRATELTDCKPADWKRLDINDLSDCPDILTGDYQFQEFHNMEWIDSITGYSGTILLNMQSRKAEYRYRLKEKSPTKKSHEEFLFNCSCGYKTNMSKDFQNHYFYGECEGSPLPKKSHFELAKEYVRKESYPNDSYFRHDDRYCERTGYIIDGVARDAFIAGRKSMESEK